MNQKQIATVCFEIIGRRMPGECRTMEEVKEIRLALGVNSANANPDKGSLGNADIAEWKAAACKWLVENLSFKKPSLKLSGKKKIISTKEEEDDPLPFRIRQNMKNNLIKQGTYKGFNWKILHNGIGFRCGYVCIPPEHPWYKKDCNSLDADVHGGLTYGKIEDDGFFWIGFDCAHLGDAQDPSLYPSVPIHSGEGTIRTTEYVEQECINLCEQAFSATYDQKRIS